MYAEIFDFHCLFYFWALDHIKLSSVSARCRDLAGCSEHFRQDLWGRGIEGFSDAEVRLYSDGESLARNFYRYVIIISSP